MPSSTTDTQSKLLFIFHYQVSAVSFLVTHTNISPPAESWCTLLYVIISAPCTQEINSHHAKLFMTQLLDFVLLEDTVSPIIILLYYYPLTGGMDLSKSLILLKIQIITRSALW